MTAHQPAVQASESLVSFFLVFMHALRERLQQFMSRLTAIDVNVVSAVQKCQCQVSIGQHAHDLFMPPA